MDDSGARVPENPRIVNEGPKLEYVNITLQDVIDQIKCLDCSKSYGPDGISPVFIKEGGPTLQRVLHRLFSMWAHVSSTLASLDIFAPIAHTLESSRWSM